ncbi:uncharacterized protein LOC144430674 isoform X1 [Styela clava]
MWSPIVMVVYIQKPEALEKDNFKDKICRSKKNRNPKVKTFHFLLLYMKNETQLKDMDTKRNYMEGAHRVVLQRMSHPVRGMCSHLRTKCSGRTRKRISNGHKDLNTKLASDQSTFFFGVKPHLS